MERRVLVVFRKDAGADVIADFYLGLEQLVKNTEGLISFHIHPFMALKDENGLNQAVPNVIFPDVMTVWKFNSEADLNAFVSSPLHHQIAREKFKPAVEKRIVFNNSN